MLRFLVFTDFHYKRGMYMPPVSSLESILDRAADCHADFVIHCGDFCNDYAGSPEITDAYLNNRHGLQVYGVYGNHELETQGNSMANVTPLLTNSPVHFGGEKVGYWHTDVKNFRLIGLDTNYSMTAAEAWEHNRPASHTSPKENFFTDSVGDVQIGWLEKILTDAAEKELTCLVFSHASMSPKWTASPDAPIVRSVFRKINKKRPGTVLMAVNGHYHTDHFAEEDGTYYFDVNAVHNAFWSPRNEHHYADEHTYSFTDYVDGKLVGTVERPLNTLSQGKNTWFLDKPLSAVVTIDENGIRIEGALSDWMYGILPDKPYEGVKSCIEDRTIIF